MPRKKQSKKTRSVKTPRAHASGTLVQRRTRGTHKITLRFRATANVTNALVTANELIQAVGGIATSGSTVSCIADAVRINHVKLVGVSPAAGSEVSVGYTFEGATNNEDKVEWIDISATQGVSPVVDRKPDPKTSAALWTKDVSVALVSNINCPANSVIEVSFQYSLLPDGGGGTSFSGSFTSGKMYYGTIGPSWEQVQFGS